MSTYVRRVEGRYVFRRRFPKAVAELIGRHELKRALGTADRQEALRLARAVSVEFDRICDEAGRTPAPAALSGPDVAAQQQEAATAVLEQIQSAMHKVQTDALVRMQSPGWQAELAWQKEALAAHAKGLMPPGVQMHPSAAAAALRALEAAERGDVQNLAAQPVASPAPLAPVSADPAQGLRASAQELEEALDRYCAGVSVSRARQVRYMVSSGLRFPATPDEARDQILAYCAERLEAGGKASSARVYAATFIALLKELPGFDEIKFPRQDSTAKAIRSGGSLSVDARAPVAPDTIRLAVAALQEADPVSAAALRLLSTYGCRPSELLREGPSAIQERTDIRGHTDTVFVAGLTLKKNARTRRHLPIHPDDLPLFNLVLSNRDVPADVSNADLEQYGEKRVRALAFTLRNSLPKNLRDGCTLYGLRHTCADLLRNSGAAESEVGAILGHAQKVGSAVTAIYGGQQPLTRVRELLTDVRAFMFTD